ncbi:hypothetical protein LCGC14_0691840 [marine sediment metagenome]|uniref:Uncharacterized protein n=1 Tax=marine sediment metagenome TaxID=412755 RepID=A0A0F9QKB8_9ZZZZ
MTIYRTNDTNLVTDVLTDPAGDPITVGTVNAEVFNEAGTESLIASAAMVHDAGGVWKRKLEADVVDTIPVGTKRVLVRVTVGSPVDATFERIEQVRDRRAAEVV